MEKTDSVYFAARPMDEVGGYLLEKVDQYYDYCYQLGRLHLWHKSYSRYYINKYRLGELQNAGQQGEYLMTTVNDFRNICEHIKIETTKTRPAFEPQAANTDYRSQAQTSIAKGVLDHEMQDKLLSQKFENAVQSAVYLGEGFIEVGWDASDGDTVTTDEQGNPIKGGDTVYYTLTPNNVIRDPIKDSYDECSWVITRHFADKFEVAAKYGEPGGTEQEDEQDDEYEQTEGDEIYETIIGLDGHQEEKYQTRLGHWHDRSFQTDDIPVYTFYHRPSHAMPEGRLVVFLEDETVLLDTPLPYDEVPVYRVSPAVEDGTPFGYTTAFDLLAIQEMLDILYSTVLTNQKTFGVQSILVPQNAHIEASKLAEGLSIIRYKPYQQGSGQALKPEPLQLTNTPPEIFNFITSLKHDMETISGINSVTRGNPESNLTSGAALALVEAQAIQFNKGLEQGYTHLIEKVGTAIVNILKQYAQHQRIVTIAGKSNRSLLKQFTADDLSEIDRVTVSLGNPLTKTTAGRMNLAETFLAQGFIQTPEQLLQVYETGNLDPLIEGKTMELMQIQQENEDLMEQGQTGETVGNVQAVATDSHALHIQEHRNVLAAPDARENPELVQATLAHIQEHLNILMNPEMHEFLVSLGQQPMSAPQPQTPQPGGRGSPGSPTPNQAAGAAGGVAQTAAPMGPAAQAADVNMPNQPRQPINPVSGERYTPETGGFTEGSL